MVRTLDEHHTKLTKAKAKEKMSTSASQATDSRTEAKALEIGCTFSVVHALNGYHVFTPAGEDTPALFLPNDDVAHKIYKGRLIESTKEFRRQWKDHLVPCRQKGIDGAYLSYRIMGAQFAGDHPDVADSIAKAQKKEEEQQKTDEKKEQQPKEEEKEKQQE
jgi:hypothetical protein